MRLGVTFRPQLPPERLRSVARAADEAGLDELWLWEDCFRQGGLTSAAAALAWTERISVGIGLTPVPLRNVALAAMEAATLARLFPDRFVLGIGHGVQDWMAQVGARVDSPMTLLREYADALTRLLDGERVTVDGRYVHLDAVRLDWPPDHPPMIVAGATGPKTLALSAQMSAGSLITSGRSVEEIADIRAGLDHAARERGPAAAGPIAGDPTAGGPSSEAGRARDRPTMIATVTVATGDGARDRLLDELASWDLPRDDRLGLHGDAEAIAAGSRAYLRAGVDTLVFLPAADEPDVEGLIAFLGRQVRPLL